MSRPFGVLLVCSGNSCRSPLAAAMLAARLAQDPLFRDTSVMSAGTSAWDGSPDSEGSYLVALERGLDLGDHRARMLTPELVQQVDRILTMTEAQVQRVADLGGGNKTATITAYAGAVAGPRDVPDPFGGDVSGYRRAAEMLDALMDDVVARLRREVVR